MFSHKKNYSGHRLTISSYNTSVSATIHVFIECLFLATQSISNQEINFTTYKACQRSCHRIHRSYYVPITQNPLTIRQKWPTDDTIVVLSGKSYPLGCGMCLKIVDHILCCFPHSHHTDRQREKGPLTRIPNNPFTIFFFPSTQIWAQWYWQSYCPERDAQAKDHNQDSIKLEDGLLAGHFELLFYITDKQMRGLIFKL